MKSLAALLVAFRVALPASRTLADGPPPILFTRLALPSGTQDGSQLDADRRVLTADGASGQWTSWPIEPGFGFTRLVASWAADTQAASHIRVEVQPTTESGATT